jgi:hypothetical protein
MDVEPAEIEPLHVVLDKPGGEKDVAADWGSWQTLQLTPTSPPQQMLVQNNKRKQAQIIVFAGTSAGAGAFVRVGTRAQVMNNAGGQLQPGRYPVENKQELWLGPDGTNAMIVVLLDERYE